MPLTDAEFERAFAEWQQFGPSRLIPVEQRWPTLLLHASPEDFQEARQRCREIESFAFDLAAQALAQKLSEKEALRQLARQYPRLTADCLGRTWSQAMYFASK